MAQFDSFVVFAEMRTGSNLLEAALNRLTGVHCHGEAFNPALIGYPKRDTLLGMTRGERDADPLALWQRIGSAPGLNGCRYFHDHDPRVLQPMLSDPRCAKIVLTRNPVESYVSLKIARATGQWKLGDARDRREARASFDAEEFKHHLEQLQTFQLYLLRALQTSGQTAFYVDYEDAQDLEVLNGLAAWLGVEDRLKVLPDDLVPQNPAPMEEKVANFPAMETALSRLDRFNLTRTPNFEPRRGPAVPGFVAAKGAGLLYMPIRPGPDVPVRAWLSQLGDGGLEEGFNQKTLRQWKRRHPGHRSFTVLRHPLLRAHLAFHALIERAGMADIRVTLRAAYGLALPSDGTPFAPKTEGAVFMAFLRWLKANLSLQTSLPVHPLWASQSASLLGLTQFAAPDLIAREDRLASDLAAVADAAGTPAPLFDAAATAPEAAALAAIWQPEMEKAAREAYTRDFMQFGFADWKIQAA